jgi:hypothetical protein
MLRGLMMASESGSWSEEGVEERYAALWLPKTWIAMEEWRQRKIPESYGWGRG